MKESKADIQEDTVQKLMSEKGAYKNALKEKVRISFVYLPLLLPVVYTSSSEMVLEDGADGRNWKS
jgi:hypothetical protein